MHSSRCCILPTDPPHVAASVAAAAAAQALTTKEVIARKKAAMCGDVAKALGRISSGLYIVAASQDNARRCVIAEHIVASFARKF
jgi:hypothetical protein